MRLSSPLFCCFRGLPLEIIVWKITFNIDFVFGKKSLWQVLYKFIPNKVAFFQPVESERSKRIYEQKCLIMICQLGSDSFHITILVNIDPGFVIHKSQCLILRGCIAKKDLGLRRRQPSHPFGHKFWACFILSLQMILDKTAIDSDLCPIDVGCRIRSKEQNRSCDFFHSTDPLNASC